MDVSCLRPLLAGTVRRLLVAYSGGVDSHALLHLLASQRRHPHLQERILAAVYVDHGLQAASADWGCHCEAVCRELEVAFQRLAVDARPQHGESPEAAARRTRYAALATLLGQHDALLTAHHQDDQAETLLLQLLRGAGPRGLAAMPAVAPLGRGLLLRPLLEVTRADILAYAQRHGLSWIEDASNADQGLDRNYLRHAILPRIKARWPAAARTLARSARLCAETAGLADALAREDRIRVASERPDCLHVPTLRGLEEPRQCGVLRYWLRCLKLPAPGERQLSHILSDAVAAPRDRRPCIRWPGAEVRRYRDELYALPPLPDHDPEQILALETGRSRLIPGIGTVCLRTAKGQGLDAAVVSGQNLTVRFRRGGERFRPSERRRSQALKKLLQEVGIPPWERDRLPLLYVGNSLAAVAGLGASAELAARNSQNGLVFEWQKPAPSVTV